MLPLEATASHSFPFRKRAFEKIQRLTFCCFVCYYSITLHFTLLPLLLWSVRPVINRTPPKFPWQCKYFLSRRKDIGHLVSFSLHQLMWWIEVCLSRQVASPSKLYYSSQNTKIKMLMTDMFILHARNFLQAQLLIPKSSLMSC